MKRWVQAIGSLAILLVLPLAFGVLRASAAERGAVYLRVPEDWESPHVWAWSEDGTNAFDAWPGEEAEADPDNEGWHYIWIPAETNHIIINANEGTVQTGELILEESSAWIEVTDADNAEISYEKQTKGDAPAYVEKFAVHARVDETWEAPCLWAWSAPDGTNVFDAWPGEPLRSGEDGWYTIKVPVWVNSIIVNANEGSVQTEDIGIDPAEVWVTVEADGTAAYSYVDPDKAAVGNVTIHVSAPADWEAPCLWAWSAPDGTNAFASWPGEELAEDGSGWLVKEIPGWVNSVIVNGNSGSVQTTDISVEEGRDLWLVVNGPEEFELSYEAVELPARTASAGGEAADAEDPVAQGNGEETTLVSEESVEERSGSAAPYAVGGVVAVAAVAGGAAAVRNRKKKAS